MRRAIAAALVLGVVAAASLAGAKGGPPTQSRTRTLKHEESAWGVRLPPGTTVREEALIEAAPTWHIDRVESLGSDVVWCGLTFARGSELHVAMESDRSIAWGTLARVGSASGLALAAAPLQVTCRGGRAVTAYAREATLAADSEIEGVSLPAGAQFVRVVWDDGRVYLEVHSPRPFRVLGVAVTHVERHGSVVRALTLAGDGTIDGVECHAGAARFHENGALEACEGGVATFEGARVRVLDRGDDGRVRRGTLVARAALRGVVLPAGTPVGIDKDGILRADLPRGTVVSARGYACVGTFQLYASGALGECDFERPQRVGAFLTTGVGWYESGAIAGVELVSETWVRGLPAIGGLSLFESGAMRSIQLARDYVVRGRSFPRGQCLDLSEDGSIAYVWQ
jgi:hypothetical protein